MKMTMRWFGGDDPVLLDNIRQVPGVAGVVSALYNVDVGEVWTEEALRELRQGVNACGLDLEVIESIPVHEDIKLGRAGRDAYIEAYCESIRNMGRAGIPVLCYNFMPVFDWTRTSLHHSFSDGSSALSFSYEELGTIDLDKEGAANLPGWSTVYEPAYLKDLLQAFRAMGESRMWENLAYFLKRVVPVAEASGVLMGIHPDDPPWSIFGLPRIVVDERALRRIVDIVDSPANGITLCTGSLGAHLSNRLPQIVRMLGDRINFVHMRNVSVTGPREFHESPHLSKLGSVDMYAVIKELVKIGYDGPLRPDHGRMIWGELGRPGYGMYDRSLGMMYLNGLYEAALAECGGRWRD